MNEVKDIQKLFSLEEYIHLDETGTVRHEFYYGKLFPMPGETLLHNEICIRILFLLSSMLKKTGLKTYIESVKVKAGNEEIYLYPDLVVMDPKTELSAGHKNYIIYNPLLIAEVLSDSTRKYDSTDKFIQYQKIPSLRYYLLVEPEKHIVIFYEKNDTGEWLSKVFTDLEEVIMLPFLKLRLCSEIFMSNIYVLGRFI